MTVSSHPSGPPSTFADVERWFQEDIRISKDFDKKILGSIRKLIKLPGCSASLSDIPADLEAFDRRWGTGKVQRLPSGFTSHDQYKRWRSEVRAALRKFLGIRAPSRQPEPNDEWATLRSDLAAVVPSQRVIGLDSLIRAARERGVQPKDMTWNLLMELVSGTRPSGLARAIKAAWKDLEQHASIIRCPLPAALPFPPIHRAQGHAVRVPYPPELAAMVQAWGDEKAKGERRGHRQKSRKSIKPVTRKFHEGGISYIYTALVQLGHVDPMQETDLDVLSTLDWLEEVIGAELDGDFPWQRLAPTTLFAYLSSWTLFLKKYKIDVDPHREMINDWDAFTNIKAMSAQRRQWCNDFLRDAKQQTAFFSLPATLHAHAAPMIQDFRRLKAIRRDQAIMLAMVASAAAIWTSLPLRIRTVVNLSVEGSTPDIVLQAHKTDLVLTTPVDAVKNGYQHERISLTPKHGGHPRRIVDWFIREVRPLLMAGMRPSSRKPDLLFCGVDEARLRRAWSRASQLVGLSMTPHQVRHAIATVLANEDRPDYEMIAALLGDTVATVRKNYVFVDQMRKHVAGQEALAKLQRNALAGKRK